MTMQYDVLSAHTTGDGTLVTGRFRVKGILFLGDGTAGDMYLKDGGAGGTVRIQFNIPANSNNDVSVLIPGEGVLFHNSIYADMPGTSSSITIFYG